MKNGGLGVPFGDYRSTPSLGISSQYGAKMQQYGPRPRDARRHSASHHGSSVPVCLTSRIEPARGALANDHKTPKFQHAQGITRTIGARVLNRCSTSRERK